METGENETKFSTSCSDKSCTVASRIRVATTFRFDGSLFSTILFLVIDKYCAILWDALWSH